MKKSLTLFSTLTLLLLGFTSIVKAQTFTPKYGISMTSFSHGYYEYLPKGYVANGTQKYPLLIFLGGTGELGDGSVEQLPLVLHNATPKQISQGIFPDSFLVNRAVV